MSDLPSLSFKTDLHHAPKPRCDKCHCYAFFPEQIAEAQRLAREVVFLTMVPPPRTKMAVGRRFQSGL